ncbi:Clp protease [Rhodococcus sp. HNM0563]|uniref:Clp protease N-terminal domain-containing protein n=1 Tax=unclassified Rhodococcus (in: high G+C Gram-positive bacteria) TaxID=192944 RepID=UPI00146D9BA8|nr:MULTISPECIES: Clp protease N-terminal domain-containing protein [unclassified Rhodococcus (in: high G+C Gram-positive bacteria)]MCK0090086.1 Clp protease [Rhodococcus sp. F64268]NLU64613.1 Clp protease [Rhodococcus sp. HNM0563]
MFERFSGSARAAVVAAQAEALRLNADRITPGHVLLGVLVTAEEHLRASLADVGLTVDGVRAHLVAMNQGQPLGPDDAAALEAIGIDLDAVRARLEDTFGEGVLDRPAENTGKGRGGRFSDLFGGHIPFDRNAKKTLELSLREAIAHHDRLIGSEHIMLGVIRSDDSETTSLIEAYVTRDRLRQVLIEQLDSAA